MLAVLRITVRNSVAGLALLITGCAGVSSKNPGEAVSKLDVHKVPELKALGERGRQFCNENYPKVCALLLEEGADYPKHFKLYLGPHGLDVHAASYPIVNHICINTSYYNWYDPEQDFEGTLVHEMAHIAMRGGQKNARAKYWLESIADYARFKLMGTNVGSCAECTPRYPHYTSGYKCGGAFLLFLENAHGTNLVRQLTTKLRRRTYSDQFFVNATGRELESLWKEFQTTPAFKPGAAETLRIREAIGFKDAVPPRDVYERFFRYVEQVTACAAEDNRYRRYKPGSFPPIDSLIENYLCDGMPGGSPEAAWTLLRSQNRLPGFRKGEPSYTADRTIYDRLMAQSFPKSITLQYMKSNADCFYYYTMVCDSPESGWKLTKAWRTSNDGKVLEEYPVP